MCCGAQVWGFPVEHSGFLCEPGKGSFLLSPAPGVPRIRIGARWGKPSPTHGGSLPEQKGGLPRGRAGGSAAPQCLAWGLSESSLGRGPLLTVFPLVGLGTFLYKAAAPRTRWAWRSVLASRDPGHGLAAHTLCPMFCVFFRPLGGFCAQWVLAGFSAGRA